jgi:hypothetical protein
MTSLSQTIEKFLDMVYKEGNLHFLMTLKIVFVPKLCHRKDNPEKILMTLKLPSNEELSIKQTVQ